MYSDHLTQIRSYLRAIGAEFEDNYELAPGIEGILLKNQQTFVQIFTKSNLNYDYRSFRGLTLLAHKSNTALAKSKGIGYISLNLNEVTNTPNDIDRVKYITARGVQPGKPAEEYDFTLVTKKEVVEKAEPLDAESAEIAKAKSNKLSLTLETAAAAAQATEESQSSSEEDSKPAETKKAGSKKKAADQATKTA